MENKGDGPFFEEKEKAPFKWLFVKRNLFLIFI